jgi:ABC-2 type transport system permease protein
VTATGVLFHATAFWLGPVNSLARQAWEFLITFSVYPHTIYGGVLRLLLFTALPAGFVGFLPVELVRRFEWTTLAALVGGSLVYAVLAVVVFRLGLRRYESGNRFGVRA